MKKILILFLFISIFSCDKQDEDLLISDEIENSNLNARYDILVDPPKDGNFGGDDCDSNVLIGGCIPDLNGNAGGSFTINHDIEYNCYRRILITGNFDVDTSTNTPTLTDLQISANIIQSSSNMGSGNSIPIEAYSLSYSSLTGDIIITVAIVEEGDEIELEDPIGYEGNIELVNPDLGSAIPEDTDDDGYIEFEEVDWSWLSNPSLYSGYNYTILVKQFKINPCQGTIQY